jgi:hypothetical protein
MSSPALKTKRRALSPGFWPSSWDGDVLALDDENDEDFDTEKPESSEVAHRCSRKTDTFHEPVASCCTASVSRVVNMTGHMTLHSAVPASVRINQVTFIFFMSNYVWLDCDPVWLSSQFLFFSQMNVARGTTMPLPSCWHFIVQISAFSAFRL